MPHVTEYTSAKSWEYLIVILQLSNLAFCFKYVKDNEHRGCYLTLKICVDMCDSFFFVFQRDLQYMAAFSEVTQSYHCMDAKCMTSKIGTVVSAKHSNHHSMATVQTC